MRAVAVLAAGRADARQHRRLRAVRRDLGLQRRDRRHHRHGGAAADQALGYNEPLFLGTIAAGGTLGILIPPSINLIIYGVLTDTSVPQALSGGYHPGLLLAVLFMLMVCDRLLLAPAGAGSATTPAGAIASRACRTSMPPLVIFLAVVGSIYAGVATATEAAALGVLAALVLAAWARACRWRCCARCSRARCAPRR